MPGRPLDSGVMMLVKAMAYKDPDSWMWAHALELLAKARRLERQFFELGHTSAHLPTWEPPVDVFEAGEQVWILVALPGVEPEDVQVLLEGSSLVVRGTRLLPRECRHSGVQRLEIPQGVFERRIQLRHGRFEVTLRELKNGCLHLGLRIL